MNQLKFMVWAPEEGPLFLGDIPPKDSPKFEKFVRHARAAPSLSQDTFRVVLVSQGGELVKLISESSNVRTLYVDLDEVESGNQPVSRPAQSVDPGYVERIFRLHETGALDKRIRQKGSYQSVENFQRLVADLGRAVRHA